MQGCEIGWLIQLQHSDARAYESSPKARSLGRFLGKLGSLETRTTKLGRLDEPWEWQNKRYFLAFFCCFPNLNPKSFRFLTIYSPLLMLSSPKNRCLLKSLLVFQKKTGLYKGKVCCYSRLDSARSSKTRLAKSSMVC